MRLFAELTLAAMIFIVGCDSPSGNSLQDVAERLSSGGGGSVSVSPVGSWIKSRSIWSGYNGSGTLLIDTSAAVSGTGDQMAIVTADSVFEYSEGTTCYSRYSVDYSLVGLMLSLGVDTHVVSADYTTDFSYFMSNGQLVFSNTITYNSPQDWGDGTMLSRLVLRVEYVSYTGSVPPASWSSTLCSESADSYEPDNSYGNASSIATDGTVQEHTIHVSDDEDWMVFYAVAGNSYEIETFGAIDMLLALYGVDGSTQLDSDDDGAESGLNSHLDFSPVTTAYYYVKATAYGTGAYQISVLEYSLTKQARTPGSGKSILAKLKSSVQ